MPGANALILAKKTVPHGCNRAVAPQSRHSFFVYMDR